VIKFLRWLATVTWVVVALWLFSLIGGIGYSEPIRDGRLFWAAVFVLAVCVITVGLLQRDQPTSAERSRE
jgi:preprotein translocase subunit SecG